MRDYECACTVCGNSRQVRFYEQPYPEIGEYFSAVCKCCGREERFVRVLNRKAKADMNRKAAEEALRAQINQECARYGFACRFVYQSVVITTQISDWCFDYHEARKTLWHESTTKINFENGLPAKAHCQFRARKLTVSEIINYIADHDAWRGRQNEERRGE